MKFVGGKMLTQSVRRFGELHPFHVVICGGGASAVLLAQALSARAESPLAVTIVEARAEPGFGKAYSTGCGDHVLNVPADQVSAVRHDSGHFVRWLNEWAKRDIRWSGTDFAPRQLYGEYLRATLASVQRNRRLTLSVIQDTAMDAQRRAACWTVRLASGRRLDADSVVIATGPEPPRAIAVSGTECARGRIIADPWDEAFKAAIPPDASVLLLGSGLTAIDVALELWANGHIGKITMVSRHGLLPRSHPEGPGQPPRTGSAAASCPQSAIDLLRQIRNSVKTIEEFDCQRGKARQIWSHLPMAERARFLRHLLSFWNIHRHRCAPEVGRKLQMAIDAGRLACVKGHIVRLGSSSDAIGCEVLISLAGRVSHVPFSWLVNCTAANTDIRHCCNPLIANLLERQVIRPDPLLLGIDVDPHSHALDQHGAAQADLFALGSLTTGRFWEITAVPEIAAQCEEVATALLASNRYLLSA